MKGLKKVICLIASMSVMVGAFAGCGSSDDSKETKTAYTQKDPKDYKGTITFWHFNKDEGPVMKEMFEKAYPNVKVNLQIISDQNQGYQNKLTSAIANGSGVLDVFCGESAVVKRFVNLENGFADLSQKPFEAESVINKMIPATVDIGRDDNGKIRALTYQVTPGALAYKRNVAKKYLGTDDPDKISEMISTVDKLTDVAKTLKEKSNGKVKLVASRSEHERVYFGARSEGWVKDGKLNVDPMIDKFVDVAKTYRDSGYESGLTQWQPAWAASIAKEENLFYACPSWGIANIIECNDKDGKDKGTWGLAQSPIPYTWGGTWLGVYDKSKNKELAWQFVKYMTSNKEGMKAWTKKMGDVMNNTDVIDEYKKSGTLNKTFNQNPYTVFDKSMSKINGKIMTQYDDRINAAFDDALDTYLAGKCSKDDMWKKVKEKVKSDYPELNVE